ncbi:hypothetical protein LUW76_00980 [Actinomadura madurae]|uniref:hypothetical protein n=1 Tax=Actinomadura madurae TaxID=1993 RepID=UPI002025D551|nr:hypothetical protein [Actinomadura madurae]URM93032.1 hypothetical protein LUW76_00980 [Actinomadura madurae]
MAERRDPLDQGADGGRVVHPDVGDGAARVVAPADRDEGEALGQQPGEVVAVDGAAEQDAAVGQPDPAVGVEDPPPLP